MEIDLDWTDPIPVRLTKGRELHYQIDLELVPTAPGIYIFGRRWGANFEALYVGQAGRLRARIRSHLNNARLLRHLGEARNGRRVLLAGVLIGKPGQTTSKCLNIAERAFIRHFIAVGHDLINKQGIRLHRDRITSLGRHTKDFWPQEVLVERRISR